MEMIPKARPTAAECVIIAAAAAHHRTHPSLLRQPGRRAPVARARQLAMVLLARFTRRTQTEIAEMLGLGDHGAVSHGIRRARSTQPRSIKSVTDQLLELATR